MKRRLQSIGLLLCLITMYPALTFTETSGAETDESSIRQLLTDLSAHRISPDTALDPSLSGDARRTALSYLPDASFDLNVVPGEFAFDSPNHARLTAQIHFKSANNEVESSSADLVFVKRNGRWYFSTYEFLGFGLLGVAIVTVGSVIGVSYATGGLLVMRKLRREQRLDVRNLAKVFIPLFWIGLFRRSTR